MAVPNTTTFTLQDVCTEVVPTTNDLVDCFSDSVDALFDPLYKGDKTNLLNFRNYNAGPLLDYDGNEYTTVIIGSQQWIVQNLKVEHYADGSVINNITDAATWAADTTGAMCYYDNDSATYKATYGALYNWYAVNHASGLVYFERDGVEESGWRVPTYTDFNALSFAITSNGGSLKETGTTHWLTPNTGATNSTGFTSVPGGQRSSSTFDFLTEYNTITLNTETSETAHRSFFLLYISSALSDNAASPKYYGFSVRCVRDIP